MFERLDEIDWASLNHAYGSAADVPAMLRNMASDAPEVRDNAFYEAYGNIFHQGTRYQASAPAIPFLLELLADPSYTSHADVLLLIGNLVVGYSNAFVPFGTADHITALRQDYAALRGRTDAERAADEQDAELAGAEQWLGWILAIIDEARQGVPRYIRLLTSDDEMTRICAAFVLSLLPEDFELYEAALWEAANNDPSDTVRANALVALSFAASYDAFGEYLADVEAMLEGGVPIVQFAAAIALGTCTIDPPDEVIATLLAVIAREADEDDEYEFEQHGFEDDEAEEDDEIAFGEVADATITGEDEFPLAYDWHFTWCGGDFVTHACAVLAELGSYDPIRLIDAVGQAIPQMHAVEACNITAFLLRGLFEEAYDSPDARALDNDQRRFLNILARTDVPWTVGESVFANFALLLGDFGLPSTQASLAKFLDEPVA